MWKDHGVADMSEAPPSTTSEGAFSTHQGMRRPRRVQGDLLMQKPTRGSVMASQARPTNRMMEAEKGSISELHPPVPCFLSGQLFPSQQRAAHPSKGPAQPGKGSGQTRRHDSGKCLPSPCCTLPQHTWFACLLSLLT